MKVAIIGTRGVPNNYGGFEQFAEYLSLSLVANGHEVIVYNPHNHSYMDNKWKGVQIRHQYDPEYKIGTVGQFIYDLNCIWDARKQKCDVILQLGYTSSSIWSFLFPKNAVIVTNMDGLEWKRSKYSPIVRKFLKFAERLAAKYSDVLVSDSIGIKNYLWEKYRLESHFIPYGATLFSNPDKKKLEKMNLLEQEYDVLIARMEPENNVEVILDGICIADLPRHMIVVGNAENKFGKKLKQKYAHKANIRFVGPIYDIDFLNNLRYYSNIYFHGHSVGGTNPSLLEAMASSALICAHNNIFNKAILGDNAYYFNSSSDVALVANKIVKSEAELLKVKTNSDKIITEYSWDKINGEYERLLASSKKSNNV